MESTAAVDGRALYSKITWRLIPYIFLLYIVAYLDRVNVGFAAYDLQRDLHFSNTVYGTGAGIFFLGSVLFDLPSNLMLTRVGARMWIARIMISWGVISTCMMFMHSKESFYVLRFLLGVSEAGFFPGMIIYLTYWFPTQERARAVAKFMTATSLAGVVGGPLSSYLLKLDGVGGLAGWQWLFVSEGVPTVLLGISVLFVLKDGPANAGWLRPEERTWLEGELQRDKELSGASTHHRLLDAFRLPALWVLAGVYFVSQVGVYIVNLWMPLILQSFSHGGDRDAILIARYATFPYLAAAAMTVVVGWSSDKRKERRWHIAGCLTLSAVGFAWAAWAHALVVALCAMTLAAIGLWSMMGPFWTLATSMLSGTAAAGAVAILQMVGGVGGFAGPYMTGRLRDATQSFTGGLYLISAMALGAAGLALVARNRQTPIVNTTAQ
ncbi:MFS transporter [Tunturiibacter empetritectus]|uniref:ACS family tartrate transporter-like MFS transporter n=1 Tax=Tunturiibacter lichenicola TaxID=2051959 RepID=A0A852VCM0_9BACT|nr:MFS transporter [Edaphobacter lichenicola]NYF88214.1 ACS family tartrate transporter-like MFS transporter [Edaphobacter lichenicola]